MINKGAKNYDGYIPQYDVEYLKHNGRKVQVRWNFILTNNDDSEQLIYDYINLNKFNKKTLLDNKIPYSIVSQIFTPNNVWHENDKSIKVFFDFVSINTFLIKFPNLSSYLSENNINYYVNGGGINVYVNYLLPEHEQLLNEFNAVIMYNESNNSD